MKLANSLRVPGLLLVAALVAGACGSSASDGDDVEGDHVSIAVAAPFRSLNPVMDSSALPLQKTVFERLVDIDPAGNDVPGLATDWGSNAEATEWTFTIRTDSTFHDGSTVTVGDVVFSFQQVIDSPTSTIYANVSSIDTVAADGEDKVVFRLNRPFAYFPRHTSLFSIIPKATYDEEKFATAPIGSGPYKLVSWSSGSAAELTRYDGFAGEKPDFKDVSIVQAPEADTRLTALQSGEFDLTALTIAQAEIVSNDDKLAVASTPSNFVAYLSFNVNEKPLDDPKLRQAIDHAIDRKSITENLYRSHASPIGQMVAPVSFGYDPEIEPTAFDVELAKKLVNESSYRGETIRFDFPNDGDLQEVNNLASSIQGYLKDVGINAELNGRTSTAFVPDWFGKKFPGMYMFNWRPSLLDASQVLNLSYLPTAMGYPENPELVKLVGQADGDPDPEARKTLISKVFRISRDEAYFAPLFTDEYQFGFNPTTVSYKPRADGYLVAHEVHRPAS